LCNVENLWDGVSDVFNGHRLAFGPAVRQVVETRVCRGEKDRAPSRV
jgi:hypothetical protein